MVDDPEFVTYRNLQSIVRSAALIGIIAVTMTGITMAGSFFSLSVSQTAAMAAIGFAAFMSWGWPVWAAVLITFAIAAAVGAAQGGAVALGGNPIVVTLAVGAVPVRVGRLADRQQDGENRHRRGRLGRHLATAGSTHPDLGVRRDHRDFRNRPDPNAIRAGTDPGGRQPAGCAAASGLRPGRTTVYVFGVSSLGAALAGIFIAAQFGQGRLDQFDGADIDSIAAILVGGAAIQGGEGSASRTAVGAVFIAGLQNLMVLRGFSFGVRVLFVGLAILISVSAFTVLRNRRQMT